MDTCTIMHMETGADCKNRTITWKAGSEGTIDELLVILFSVISWRTHVNSLYTYIQSQSNWVNNGNNRNAIESNHSVSFNSVIAVLGLFVNSWNHSNLERGQMENWTHLQHWQRDSQGRRYPAGANFPDTAWSHQWNWPTDHSPGRGRQWTSHTHSRDHWRRESDIGRLEKCVQLCCSLDWWSIPQHHGTTLKASQASATNNLTDNRLKIITIGRDGCHSNTWHTPCAPFAYSFRSAANAKSIANRRGKLSDDGAGQRTLVAILKGRLIGLLVVLDGAFAILQAKLCQIQRVFVFPL